MLFGAFDGPTLVGLSVLDQSTLPKAVGRFNLAGLWVSQAYRGRGIGKKDPCRLLWTEMVISWDGRVSLCCNDYENKAVLGDIKTQSIKEIWSGERLNSIRNFHKKRKFDRIGICKNCEYNYHDKSNWWVSK